MIPSQVETIPTTTNAVASFRNENYNTDIPIDFGAHMYSQSNEIDYVEQQLQFHNDTNNQ